MKFAMFTESVDQLCLKPVSTLLLSWLLKLKPPGQPIEFSLDDFQDYSSNSRSNAQSYSKRQIKRGLDELASKGVLEIARQWWGGIYQILIYHPSRNPTSDTETKKSPDVTQTSKSVTKKSKIEPSKPDSTVPLNREYKETTDTPTHFHPVLEVQSRIDNEGTLPAMSDPIQAIAKNALAEISKPSNAPTQQAPQNPTIVPLFSEERKIEPDPEPKPEPEEPSIDPQLLSDVKTVIAPMPLNTNLKRVIQDAEPEAVRNAIAVVKENQAKGTVKRAAGLLSKAIRQRWTPNEGKPAIPDGFTEWFNLAKEKGIVAASTIMAGEMMVCVDRDTGDWKPWAELSAAFTMSYLRQMPALGLP